jgi:hypothetical protein
MEYELRVHDVPRGKILQGKKKAAGSLEAHWE